MHWSSDAGVQFGDVGDGHVYVIEPAARRRYNITLWQPSDPKTGERPPSYVVHNAATRLEAQAWAEQDAARRAAAGQSRRRLRVHSRQYRGRGR